MSRLIIIAGLLFVNSQCVIWAFYGDVNFIFSHDQGLSVYNQQEFNKLGSVYLLLSRQPRVTVTSCYVYKVYKVIRDS